MFCWVNEFIRPFFTLKNNEKWDLIWESRAERRCERPCSVTDCPKCAPWDTAKILLSSCKSLSQTSCLTVLSGICCQMRQCPCLLFNCFKWHSLSKEGGFGEKNLLSASPASFWNAIWRGCLLFNSNIKLMKKWPWQARGPFSSELKEQLYKENPKILS